MKLLSLNMNDRTKIGRNMQLQNVQSVFTLIVTNTEIETETNKMRTQPNGNLCCHVSLHSVNTSTQFHISKHINMNVLHDQTRPILLTFPTFHLNREFSPVWRTPARLPSGSVLAEVSSAFPATLPYDFSSRPIVLQAEIP